jgi:serine/threonine protein kinase
MKTEDELDIPARFNPGPGYKIEKRLGQGRWKIAFRGRAEGYTADIALICFHSAGPENVVEDLTGLLRASTGYKFRGYLPKLHRIFWDPDNRLWIQEELMKESLQSVRPLHEAGRLARIARDLSRGLTCLHEGGLVHRDIKLDNCGLDYNGTAKIFDLGSVAKMGQEGLCTITTRAPEYLSVGVGSYAEAKVIFNKSADVWALGATLYALKTGAYPFVTPDDEKKRAWLNKELVDGRLAAGAVDAQKAEMDECIRQRALAVQFLPRYREC